MISPKENHLKMACRYLESATTVSTECHNVSFYDWHSLQAITSQLQQAMAYFNRALGALEQEEK